ncbi:helix-turn-helix domain-containing protein [Polymorphobacter sp.]|uniref:helix-turn-helix domain-containing protein n=1 Tax=Polymorphobacter sp. TaxID=1909290 RepID=UPI003F70A785
MLAAARRAAGIELAEIAQNTRVPLRHLRALEADSHDALPALPYAQGFVRAFARAVSLDPDVMVARFRAETSKQPHVPTPTAMAALDERRLPAPGLVIASLVALVVVIGLLSAWGSGAFDPDLPQSAGVPVAGIAQSPAQPPTPALTSPPPAIIGTGTTSDTVVLTAREEVWVRIYDPATRTVALSGVMAPGQRFEVPSDPPGLRLWTGRAGALSVTLGGREIPPLGGPAQVLRDLSLAAADLRARPAPAPAGSPVSAPPAGGISASVPPSPAIE